MSETKPKIVTTRIEPEPTPNNTLMAAWVDVEREVGGPVALVSLEPAPGGGWDASFRLCGSAYPEPTPP